MPLMAVLGPQVYKKELNEFFGTYEHKGVDFADPDLAPIIRQEEKGALERATMPITHSS